jgi:hypothetical protein
MTDQAPEREAGAAASASAMPLRQSPTADVLTTSDEDAPTGHVIADAYADAADPTGEVKSTKQVPEPDSLGG